jgi:hypothetical protein
MTEPIPISPTPLDLAELRRLEAAATPGPWAAAVGSGSKRRKQQIALIGRADMRGQGEAGCIAVLAGVPATHRADDAELCAALRNAAPSLLAAAEAVQRVRDLAKTAIREAAAVSPYSDAVRQAASAVDATVLAIDVLEALDQEAQQ